MTPFPPRETVSPAETIDELLGFASLVVVGTLSEPESAGLLYPADTLEPGWSVARFSEFRSGMSLEDVEALDLSLETSRPLLDLPGMTSETTGRARETDGVRPLFANQYLVYAVATHVAGTDSAEDNTRAAELFDFEFTLDTGMVDPVTDYSLDIEQVLLDGTGLNVEPGSALPLRIYGHDPAADISTFEGQEYLQFETNLEPGQRYLILLDTYEFETDIFTEVPYAEGAYLLAEDGVTLADGSDVPYAKGISPEAFIRMVSVAIGKRE